MAESNIHITISTDENKVPSKIMWTAEDGQVKNREAKAMALSMWDEADETAMQMGLWTKKMSVEEMQHFVCQTMMTLADSFEQATSDKEHAKAIRGFTEELAKRLGVLKSN